MLKEPFDECLWVINVEGAIGLDTVIGSLVFLEAFGKIDHAHFGISAHEEIG